jgi:hypothetical protein
MAIKLSAAYSKKLGLPGFSSHFIHRLNQPELNAATLYITKYPLANGDSNLSPMGTFGASTNFTIPALLRFQSEKDKKGERTNVKNRAVPTQQKWRKNKT